MYLFSIIICTYNPNLIIFKNVLEAIVNLDSISTDCEVIIVDNNSMPGLSENCTVQNFLKRLHNARIVKENVPGLTAARIRGIREANSNWIIFFDDDNEPSEDYLIEASKVILEYPKVGAWGPGIVNVKYIDKNAPKWLNKYKFIFQERNDNSIKFDNSCHWQFCYPFGTGLIIKKEICETYIEKVENNHYFLSDRKGKSLSSGGDLQLVYTALIMNYFAGVSPGIKLNHLISSSKSNTRYIAKLLFASASCNLPAYYQCFPDKINAHSHPSLQNILLKIYYLIKVVFVRNGFREAYFQLARYLGELEGIMIINTGFKKKKLVLWLEQMLKFR